MSSLPKLPFPVSLEIHVSTALSVVWCYGLKVNPMEKFHNSMCLLITEAKAGTAPTPTTKSIGLGKVAAQKKQESSSEDSSSDSEDEQPTKVYERF